MSVEVESRPVWLTAVMPVKMADNVKYSRWTSGRTNGVSRTVSKRHDSVEAALAEAARLPECAV